jgi:hypothetical protein
VKEELVTVLGTVVHRLKNVGVDALATLPAQNTALQERSAFGAKPT